MEVWVCSGRILSLYAELPPEGKRFPWKDRLSGASTMRS